MLLIYVFGGSCQEQKQKQRGPQILFQHFNNIEAPPCNLTDSALLPAALDAITQLHISTLNCVFHRLQHGADGRLSAQDEFSCAGCSVRTAGRTVAHSMLSRMCAFSRHDLEVIYGLHGCRAAGKRLFSSRGRFSFSPASLFLPCRAVVGVSSNISDFFFLEGLLLVVIMDLFWIITESLHLFT